MKIRKFVVLGGGSAGLLAAITLKRAFREPGVVLVRSPEIGVIGVGEGTTPAFPGFLHGYLQIPPREFYERAKPTWKLGLRLLWGPRDGFNYAFQPQMDRRLAGLSRASGYYAMDDFDDLNVSSALMERNRVFPRAENGAVTIDVGGTPYHVENVHLVDYLEWRALQEGVEIRDATVAGAAREDDRVIALDLAEGERQEGDFFIDASGFRAELIGKTFGESFVDYSDALFCDRAVVGPRERLPDEPIRPYTTAETMDHGWCWQIEHERHVNRGYVYSSAFVSDDEAEAEFRRINPRVERTRLVRFRSGRFARTWIGNVVAVGNASGFVEPLEATALTVLCSQLRHLVTVLADNAGDYTPTKIAGYNGFMAAIWDHVRDFLALHYRFNTRRDTPFWRHCLEKTPLGGLAPLVDYYRENGPSLILSNLLAPRESYFGIDGIYTMLVGMNVPCERSFIPDAAEIRLWESFREENRRRARTAMTVEEALAFLRGAEAMWKRTSGPKGG